MAGTSFLSADFTTQYFRSSVFWPLIIIELVAWSVTSIFSFQSMSTWFPTVPKLFQHEYLVQQQPELSKKRTKQCVFTLHVIHQDQHYVPRFRPIKRTQWESPCLNHNWMVSPLSRGVCRCEWPSQCQARHRPVDTQLLRLQKLGRCFVTFNRQLSLYFWH